MVPLLISWGCVGLLMVSGWTLRPVDIARGWAIAALLSSVIGLLQYFGHADAFSPWVHVPEYLGEARGNLRQRNQLATLTSMGVVAIVCWVRMGLPRLQAVWMLALVTVGNAATHSRTGLLQMLLVTGLLLWWSWRDTTQPERLSWRLALWALGIYALAIWALPQMLSLSSGLDSISVLTRLSNDDGCASRKVLWRNVLELIAQKPWWGWGWDELKYAHYSASYSGERFCEILGNAHNGPLQLAFVWGLPIAALITIGLLAIVLRMRPWRARQTHEQLAWGILAVMGLHSLLEFPLWYGPFQIATLLALGLVIWGQAMPGSLGAWRVAGLALLLLCAHVAQDYVRVRQVFVPSEQRLVWGGVPAWSRASQTVWFQDTYRFAAYITREVSAENAAWMLQEGQALLHYSPEPRVIDRILCSAALLGRQDVLDLHGPRRQIALAIERRTPVQAVEVPLAACPAS